jgi:hypothetical protein
VLLESPSPDLSAKSEIEQGKEIRFITHQMKRRTGRVNLSKLCCSTSGKKYLLFQWGVQGLILSM